MTLNSAINAGGGTSTTVLHGNATGSPSYGAVVLNTDVSGILPVGNGGTGINSGTLNAVPYFNTTTTLTTSANFTYNGTNLIVNGAFAGAFVDGDKLLLLGKTNSAKIAHAAGWVAEFFAGSFTSDGGAASTGLFEWFTVDATGAAWALQMSLSNTGVLNISSLSASQIVVTDASKNLISLAGTTTTVLHGNASGAPTYGAVVLTTDVTNTLPVGNGGTGITSGTSGGVLYFSSTSTIASSGLLTANTLVLGGGAGAAPTSLGTGTTTTVLHGNAGGAPTYGAVVLTTDVTNTLPVGNGGTGTATTFTQGSVIFAGASGIYSQNNSAFFWSNTGGPSSLGSLSIGTTSTTYTLNVENTSTAAAAASSLVLVQTASTSAITSMLDLFAPSSSSLNTSQTFIRFGASSSNYGAINLQYSGGSVSNVAIGIGATNIVAISTTSVDVISTLFSVHGNFSFFTLGSTMTIPAGGLGTALVNGNSSNARMGRLTLNGATGATITNTTITANSLIFISRSTIAGTIGNITYTLVAGTSFTVKSSSAETSIVNFLIIEGT